MIGKVYGVVKAQGISGLLDIVARRAFPPRFSSYSRCLPLFKDKIGLEIGGPSGTFKRNGILPVYPVAARIDNCNFGAHTTWEGRIEEGATFVYDTRRSPGIQYVSEATDLSRIPSTSYDFVLSSHTLEHVANPLKALFEWTRVLKGDGVLALIVPHRDGTFDHRRPVTLLSHLIQDFEEQVGEGDLTHLGEILELHDMAKDPGAGDFDAFRQRSIDNVHNRCLHHHVFDTPLAVELTHHVGLQIVAVEALRPYDICIVSRKLPPGQALQNEAFRRATPSWQSPFPSDRPTA